MQSMNDYNAVSKDAGNKLCLEKETPVDIS